LTTQSMAKLHRHKKSHCEFDPHNNSVLGIEHRTKDNTEYRTSVQKITLLQQVPNISTKNYFVTTKQRKLWKETNPETIVHSNSFLSSRQLLKLQKKNKIRTINWIWFWTFLLSELMLLKLQTLHCNGIQILKHNHSNRSLTKV